MAFDAGMLAALINEIKTDATGAKIEKIYQPERDEFILLLHTAKGNRRLLINAGGSNPRIGFTEIQKENPQKAPMLCMLLRKHLSGAKLSCVRQIGFDRVLILEFDTYDEMGFAAKKKLAVELMGKYGNLIVLDADDRIISAMKLIGISISEVRQILPGMIYEAPPKQNKCDPTECDKEKFTELYENSEDIAADKFIMSNFSGISPLIAREISFIATRFVDTPLKYVGADSLWRAFSSVMEKIKTCDFTPTVIFDADGMPIEYSFIDLRQYGGGYEKRHTDSFCALLDLFFETRDREQKIRRHASDISRLLSNAESRLRKKLGNFRRDLEEHKKGEKYKRQGDIITANIHLLKKGDKSARLVDYYAEPVDGVFPEYEITLDERLTPAANAQRMYKLYNKSKNALVEIAEQIKIAEAELEYIETVKDALSRAECESDMNEIREELYHSGYASKMKDYTAKKVQSKPNAARFRTSGGFTVLCGKNNTQNEYLTFKLGEPQDMWFHAKNQPGSHVVLRCGEGEPYENDLTEAAEIAALYSNASGGNIAVDYTRIKNIKKPRGTKPGYVTYSTNRTAYVTPNEEKIKKMRI